MLYSLGKSTYNVYITVFSAISDRNISCNPLTLRCQLNRSKTNLLPSHSLPPFPYLSELIGINNK